MRALIPLAAVVGLALSAASGIAEAQGTPPPMRRIAYLTGDAACTSNSGLNAFREGLRSLGYREGESVAIECRSAEGRYEQLDRLAAELLQRNPVVFVAAAAPASLAAKSATASVPIISVYTADPVGLGLVESLARPGTNVTGISALALDHAAKSLQLLTEVAPRAARVGVLGHTANPTHAMYRRELEPAGRAIGIELDFVGVEDAGEIEAALAAMQMRGADAILVMHQPFTFVHRQLIVDAVARLRLPAMFGSREAVESGGLLSYAASIEDMYRRAAYFVDRVLHGLKPGDLPVEQPTRFELGLNLRAAKALGLTVPPSLLLRADEVIE